MVATPTACRPSISTREEALDKASKRNDLDLQIKNVDLAKKRDLAAESGESAEEMLAGEVVQLKEIR